MHLLFNHFPSLSSVLSLKAQKKYEYWPEHILILSEGIYNNDN
jgi:hypothetical protein